MNCLRELRVAVGRFTPVQSGSRALIVVDAGQKRSLHQHKTSRTTQLTANQVATALRPFFFEVHPDRFWNEPSAKQLNESSLKQLNQHLETLTSNRNQSATSLSLHRPQLDSKTVSFYVRKGKNSETVLKLIDIKLSAHDNLRSTIKVILTTAKLSTDYLNQFGSDTADNSTPHKEEPRTHVKVDGFWSRPQYRWQFEGFDQFRQDAEEQLRQKPKQTLVRYLRDNIELSREKERQTLPVRTEISKLKTELISDLKLNNLIFDSSWSINNFRASLVNLRTISQQHHSDLGILENRTLIFGNKTGLTSDGALILNIEDVRQNWIKSIKTVNELDYLIEEIPKLENKLSLLLSNIKISKRKFQQSKLIQDYREQLLKMIKALIKYENYDEDSLQLSKVYQLNKMELVVEGDAGPLMLSPTGQFIAPSSCPATILISFLITNQDDARRLMRLYHDTKDVETNYVNRCLVELNLAGIDKDDNLTPDLMINCLISLLDNKELLRGYLRGSRLIISKYYGVQETGEICIPFNWDL